MKKFKDFLKDKSGATALTFGLLLVPLLGMTGLAVDYTRASSDRADLQNAADAAVLWGASTYDGTNLPMVKTRVLQSLRANLTNFDSSGATYDVQVTADVPARISVTLARPTNTLFMQVLNSKKVDIGVQSEASGALMPKTATIQVTNVKGIYYKKITIMVVGIDGAETQAGSIEYTYVNSTGTSTPPVGGKPLTIDLGSFSSFYFTMIVKKDGCPIGQKPEKPARGAETCVPAPKINSKDDPYYQITPTPDNLSFPDDQSIKNDPKTNAFLVRSDRANDAWRFVADGGQSTTAGAKEPILMNQLMNCKGLTQKHGWEDGGGGTPDFEYTLKTGCGLDYSKVRLTN
ncbi:hypothetical protein HB779_06760 [Phyllobacterium sp. 628]|uniref:TadE/TadG family type IV pilus assembly protein n=1 Tax=Phyllobacterium sp. 628 TaxID=2718938 RepID=UPI0016624A9D|nr:TadE/TadG family type IV pilus assembly protein [Phyllobacterium sp. 628]QND51631.1 hypothetical protein HB779_06760 [Phyllobacterium sp. 628]